ncbi:MAG: 5-(carboxyamino)imidazole ribonucleotide mutase [Halobacteriovoraceae bacterium]|nr:5-(carboxyamino)imidazole ribonucleotide mutase [Halobacteriovoraceae bacterium]
MGQKIAIIMGSSSDLKVMQGAVEALEQFGVNYDVKVVSAHRTPQGMLDFAKSARKDGYSVVIAGAGGAAHLPGMVASATSLPVIGVPVNSSNSISGVDSLLSICQMPKGIPVATMAVDGAFNGGLLAVRILSVSDEKLATKYDEYEKSLQDKVHQMNKDLNS